ncbi:MAG: hypothetical protein AAGB15_08745 [Pseudomonadota bacterium]
MPILPPLPFFDFSDGPFSWKFDPETAEPTSPIDPEQSSETDQNPDPSESEDEEKKAPDDEPLIWTESTEFGGTEVATITLPNPDETTGTTETNQPTATAVSTAPDPFELNEILKEAADAFNNPPPLPSPFNNHPPDPGLPTIPEPEEDYGLRIPEFWG